MLAGRIVAGPLVRGACERHLRDLERDELVWDAAAGIRAIDFFRGVLRLNAGKFESLPFNPEPWQAFVICSLFGWKRPNGQRRFRWAYVETGKGPLALDTPIPTPDGWTTMGDLRPGDRVFDEAGRPTEVVAVSPVFRDRACFRVTWSDGSSIVADAQHRWPVSGLRSFGKPGPKPIDAPRKGGSAIRTTAELSQQFRMPSTQSKHPQAKYNYRSEVGGCLELPPRALPVPPYTLGAWLGDGDSDAGRITCADADAEIIERIRLDGVPALQRQKQGTTHRYVLGGDRRQAARNASIEAQLRMMGLLGNKHIPEGYLRASEAQRRALLQGLLDTDGCALPGSQIELTSVHRRLTDGACELIRSLGYKVTCTEGDAQLDGRVVGRRWRIRFTSYRDEAPVFGLARKQNALGCRPATRALSDGRMIVNVEPVESVPVRCITVAAESHQFLAGEGLVPTCNSGKSPLAAGIGLYMLTADGESRAEVYAAATKKDQAMVLFRDAVAMFQQSPELRERLLPSGGNPIWQLTYLTKASWFKPISNDDGQSGPRPSCALIDELHEHPDAKTVEMLEAGFKFRENPLMFMITNSGSDQTTVCWKYHDLIARIVAGEVHDDEVFGYVCALDDGDDPFEDESCWIKANPSLGVTIREDYLRSRIAKARNLPDKRNECLRLNFCVWTDAEAAWMTKPVWKAVQKPWPLESLRGRKVWLGADLAIRGDLCALAGVVELEPDEEQRRRFAAWAEFWLPREKLRAKEDQDGQPYSRWAEEGHLHLSEGSFVRQEFMAKRLVEVADIFDLQAVAYDEYAVKWLEVALDDLGADLPLMEHPQGFRRGKLDEEAIKAAKMRGEPKPAGLWMPDSILKTEELIVEQLIEVNPSPILTWNIASATFERDPQGNRKLSKRKSTGRIDGAVALVMACGAALNAPGDPSPPTYLRSGGLIIA